jgi:hypothetical protein
MQLVEEVVARAEVPGLHDGLVAGVLQGLGDPLCQAVSAPV